MLLPARELIHSCSRARRSFHFSLKKNMSKQEATKSLNSDFSASIVERHSPRIGMMDILKSVHTAG